MLDKKIHIENILLCKYRLTIGDLKVDVEILQLDLFLMTFAALKENSATLKAKSSFVFVSRIKEYNINSK